ncbi:hypothetical protein AVEN_69091-1 [Araneus ventricosus]|uniref:Uncharacterized protein n=1 Tax=Araneus ventricosus TaxID=182803 RepID=A0A4Y2S0W7_ARAVE|nr:hypothetical protein AVEN_69091-1 [Araneus ventricosus]
MCNYVNPALQLRAPVGSTIFIPVKRLLSMQFGNDRIISLHFLTNWPPRQPDLNSFDLLLWVYMKHAVFNGPIANLAEFKARIALHIHNISTDPFRSVVEHAIFRFKLVSEDGGQHIRHCLSKYRDH